MAGPVVLLIDPDAVWSGAVAAELRGRGYQVESEPNGDHLLERSAAPSAIVLCIDLPAPGGWALCSRIKRSALLSPVPLVVLSAEASADEFDAHRQFQSRADEYLRKPIAPEAVRAAVDQLLGPKAPEVAVPAAARFEESGELQIEMIAEAAPEGVELDEDGVEPDEDVAGSGSGEGAGEVLQLNEEEADAILAALDLDAILTDESPPGTGASPPAAPETTLFADPPAPTVIAAPPAATAPALASVESSPPAAAAVEPSTEPTLEIHLPISGLVEPLPVEAAASPPRVSAPVEDAGLGKSALPDPSLLPVERAVPVASAAPVEGAASVESAAVATVIPVEKSAVAIAVEPPAAALPAPAAAAPATVEAGPPEREALEAQIRHLERELDEARRRPRLTPPPLSRDREVLQLREVINKKEKELLDLRDGVAAKDRQLLDQKDAIRQLERARREQDERLLEIENELVSVQERFEALTVEADEARAESARLQSSAESSHQALEAARAETATWKARFTEDVSAARARSETIRAELEAQLAAERLASAEQHARDIAELEKNNGAELAEQARRREAEIEEVREAFQRHEQDLQALRERHAAELSALGGDLSALNAERESIHVRTAELEGRAQLQRAELEIAHNAVAELTGERSRLQQQILKALQRIQRDDAAVTRARKALAIALTLLDETGSSTEAAPGAAGEKKTAAG